MSGRGSHPSRKNTAAAKTTVSAAGGRGSAHRLDWASGRTVSPATDRDSHRSLWAVGKTRPPIHPPQYSPCNRRAGNRYPSRMRRTRDISGLLGASLSSVSVPSARVLGPLRCGARSAPRPQPPAGARQARPQAAARPIPGGRSAGLLRGARSLGAVGPRSARGSDPQPGLSASRPGPLDPSPSPEALRGAHSSEMQWPLLPPRQSLFIFAERRERLGGGAGEGRGIRAATPTSRPLSGSSSPPCCLRAPCLSSAYSLSPPTPLPLPPGLLPFSRSHSSIKGPPFPSA